MQVLAIIAAIILVLPGLLAMAYILVLCLFVAFDALLDFDAPRGIKPRRRGPDFGSFLGYLVFAFVTFAAINLTLLVIAFS